MSVISHNLELSGVERRPLARHQITNRLVYFEDESEYQALALSPDDFFFFPYICLSMGDAFFVDTAHEAMC